MHVSTLSRVSCAISAVMRHCYILVVLLMQGCSATVAWPGSGPLASENMMASRVLELLMWKASQINYLTKPSCLHVPSL